MHICMNFVFHMIICALKKGNILYILMLSIYISYEFNHACLNNCILFHDNLTWDYTFLYYMQFIMHANIYLSILVLTL